MDNLRCHKVADALRTRGRADTAAAIGFAVVPRRELASGGGHDGTGPAGGVVLLRARSGGLT
jgi:hypothetical protein